MSKKAIIFDLDGVLVNSQPFHFDVDIKALQAFGACPTLEDVKQYAGMALIDRVKNFIESFAITATTEQVVDYHITTMMNLLETTALHPIKGVAELLALLKNRNIATSVASSSSPAFIVKMLDKLRLTQYFDFIISGEDMERSKPAPDVFLFAANKHGLTVNECVVVEDSTNGVAAAKAANIYCVGYINHTSGEQDISRADIVVDSFFKLIDDKVWLS